MHKPLEHLLPKIIAGGLSAGLVLVWWPALFPDSGGAVSWVWRGLVWTLIFELLLGLLIPLQDKIAKQSWTKKAKVSLQGQGNRLRGWLPESTLLSGIALALVALALPAGLIISGPDKAKAIKAEKAEVKTKIVKPVKVVRVTKVIKQKEIKVVPQVKIKREVKVIHVKDKTNPPEPSTDQVSEETAANQP